MQTKLDLHGTGRALEQIRTSTSTGEGIEELRRLIAERLGMLCGLPRWPPSLARGRHHVEACLEHLRHGELAAHAEPPELLALELRLCARASWRAGRDCLHGGPVGSHFQPVLHRKVARRSAADSATESRATFQPVGCDPRMAHRARRFLDAQELIVLRQPLAAGDGADLDLPRPGRRRPGRRWSCPRSRRCGRR